MSTPHEVITPLDDVERKAARRASLERNRLDALKRFDALPDSAGVRVHIVAAVTGYGVASVWRLSGTVLPKPRKVSARCTIWLVGELRDTLKRIASAA